MCYTVASHVLHSKQPCVNPIPPGGGGGDMALPNTFSQNSHFSHCDGGTRLIDFLCIYIMVILKRLKRPRFFLLNFGGLLKLQDFPLILKIRSGEHDFECHQIHTLKARELILCMVVHLECLIHGKESKL